MVKKLCRFLVVLLVGFLFVSQISVIQAQASWGAEKILEILQQQKGNPPNPVTPDPRPDPIVPDPPPIPVDPEPEVDPQDFLGSQESELWQLVNTERAKNGLKPLAPLAELTNLARLKSQDMIENNYFAHISPTYGSFGQMVYQAGIPFYSVGENIAKGRNALHAFYLFMGSPGHKANMLNPNFTHLGIGILQDQYGVAVTQLFIMK